MCRTRKGGENLAPGEVEKLRKEITRQALKLALIETIKDPLQRELTLGEIFLKEGQLGLAELSFSKVLEKTANPSFRVAAMVGLARVLRARKAWEEALRQLDKAMEEIRDANVNTLIVSVVQEKAEVLKAQGKLNEAKDCLKKLWDELNQEGSDPSLRAGVAFNLGLVLQLLFHHREACALLEEAEKLWLETNEVASGLAKLAQVSSLLELGKTSEALVKVEEAEKLFANDPMLRKLAAWARGHCLEILGRLEEALEVKESALDPDPKASEFADLAELHFSLGQPEKARKYELNAEEALAAKSDIDPHAYFSLFSLAMMRGDIFSAAKHMAALVDHYAGVAQTPSERMALRMNQALLWFEKGLLGQVEEALEEMLSEVERLKEEGAHVDSLLLEVLEFRGRLKNLEGETQEAINCYQVCLELARKLRRPMAIAGAYANLGQLYLGQGDLQQASSLLKEAERIYRACKAKYSMGYLRLNLARVSSSEAANTTEVLRILKNTVKENESSGSARLDVAGLMALATMQVQSSRFEEARANYLRALEISSSHGLEFCEILVQALLGLLEGESGHNELAEQWLGQALEKMQSKGIEIPLAKLLAERFNELMGFW